MEPSQILELQNLLSQLEPGYLPEPIFLEFTRLSVSAILELVPLRRNRSGQIEVLVVKRSEKDPHWPNMLHTPGTVLRPTDDDTFHSAVERVFHEIGRKNETYILQKVDSFFHTVNRGKELAVVFAVLIDDVREGDIWITLDQIEEKVVTTQIKLIKRSVEVVFK